jgi:ankyrin repeat protein
VVIHPVPEDDVLKVDDEIVIGMGGLRQSPSIASSLDGYEGHMMVSGSPENSFHGSNAAQLLLPAFLCSAAKDNDTGRLNKLVATTDGDDYQDVGAMLSKGDYDNRTPLMVAAAACNEDAIQFLLMNGARVNDVDRWGSTALWEAITSSVKRSDAAANILLSHGAKVLLPTHRLVGYLNQLVSACNVYQLARVVRLSGCSPDIVDYDYRTPLHLAVDEKQADAAKVLMTLGADPSLADRWGHIPRGRLEEWGLVQANGNAGHGVRMESAPLSFATLPSSSSTDFLGRLTKRVTQARRAPEIETATS